MLGVAGAVAVLQQAGQLHLQAVVAQTPTVVLRVAVLVAVRYPTDNPVAVLLLQVLLPAVAAGEVLLQILPNGEAVRQEDN